jgi:hypothetical protein
MLVVTLMGLVMEGAFAGILLQGDLRHHIIPFLSLYGVACAAYGAACLWMVRRVSGRSLALTIVFTLAIAFRVTLLAATPPTLSDDVYRYIWDGHLTGAGINPYAYPVNSPQLDGLDIEQRALVNHPWMASPYLPVAQAFFAVVYGLAPASPLAFQVGAAVVDLLAGLLLIDLLRRVGLRPVYALIYLWNPLVVFEFAHGAHVDAWMILLTMLALWTCVVSRSHVLSASALAVATLTKGLPLLLLPVLARRWRWRHLVVYAGLVSCVCVVFVLGVGWGLRGPLDGEGLFGALRIYVAQWDYNGSLFRWLAVVAHLTWTGRLTAPAFPGAAPTLVAKLVVAAAMTLVLGGVWRQAGRYRDDLSLLRLAAVPVGAYLLMATTVHPWYVTFIIPLMPFLLPASDEVSGFGRLALPWLVFSALVALSYLSYRVPGVVSEDPLIYLAEYVPFYGLLIWSAWSRRSATRR